MSQSFVDYARIHVKGGDGGEGNISFHREKFVPRGGPDGGDGGRGASIWFVADTSVATLLDIKLRPLLRAEPGENGGTNQRSGKSGADMTIRVPLGTVVSDEEGNSLADIIAEGQKFLAAEGGRGGLGNQHFATPSNQAPRKTVPAAKGEERVLILELKLIAEAGLVGLPNAGKSTLLAALTAATPKIAPYPFTTLHPNLGVMQVDNLRRLTIADIPGLIEGAVHGAGLGTRFLRHIERTAMLVHLIAPPDEIDPESDPEAAAEHVRYAYQLVRNELESYSPAMTEKLELAVLTKIDLLTPETRERLIGALRELGLNPVGISAKTGEGVPELIDALAKLTAQIEPPASTEETPGPENRM